MATVLPDGQKFGCGGVAGNWHCFQGGGSELCGSVCREALHCKGTPGALAVGGIFEVSPGADAFDFVAGRIAPLSGAKRRIAE